MPSYENMIQINTPCCSQTLHQAHLTIQVPKQQFLQLVDTGSTWQYSRISDTGHICCLQLEMVVGDLFLWTELSGDELLALEGERAGGE